MAVSGEPLSNAVPSVEIKDVLQRAKTIAVVGCSPRGFQTSHRIAQYLQGVGYRIVPVNPYHDEILGEACYPALQAIPEDVNLDIVNVFRRSEFTPGVVEDAIVRMEATGDRPLIWTQLGVHHPEAEALAAEAELDYVADRCIMVDHGMLVR